MTSKPDHVTVIVAPPAAPKPSSESTPGTPLLDVGLNQSGQTQTSSASGTEKPPVSTPQTDTTANSIDSASAKLNPILEQGAEKAGEAVRNVTHAVVTETPILTKDVANRVTHPGDTVQGATKTAGNALSGFLGNLKGNAGSIAGGLLGVLGAWFASSIFGQGPLKMVFLVLLAPLFGIIGAQKLGPTIEGWITGKKPDGNAPAQGQALQPNVGAALQSEQQPDLGAGRQPQYGQPQPYTPSVSPGYNAGYNQSQDFGGQLYEAGAYPPSYYRPAPMPYRDLPSGYTPEPGCRVAPGTARPAAIGYTYRP